MMSPQLATPRNQLHTVTRLTSSVSATFWATLSIMLQFWDTLQVDGK